MVTVDRHDGMSIRFAIDRLPVKFSAAKPVKLAFAFKCSFFKYVHPLLCFFDIECFVYFCFMFEER